MCYTIHLFTPKPNKLNIDKDLLKDRIAFKAIKTSAPKYSLKMQAAAAQTLKLLSDTSSASQLVLLISPAPGSASSTCRDIPSSPSARSLRCG